jgi:hypothetical protein
MEPKGAGRDQSNIMLIGKSILEPWDGASPLAHLLSVIARLRAVLRGGLDRGVMMLEIEKIVALRETKQGGLTRVV